MLLGWTGSCSDVQRPTRVTESGRQTGQGRESLRPSLWSNSGLKWSAVVTRVQRSPQPAICVFSAGPVRHQRRAISARPTQSGQSADTGGERQTVTCASRSASRHRHRAATTAHTAIRPARPGPVPRRAVSPRVPSACQCPTPPGQPESGDAAVTWADLLGSLGRYAGDGGPQVAAPVARAAVAGPGRGSRRAGQTGEPCVRPGAQRLARRLDRVEGRGEHRGRGEGRPTDRDRDVVGGGYPVVTLDLCQCGPWQGPHSQRSGARDSLFMRRCIVYKGMYCIQGDTRGCIVQSLLIVAIHGVGVGVAIHRVGVGGWWSLSPPRSGRPRRRS